jgi:hypothetical protein
MKRCYLLIIAVVLCIGVFSQNNTSNEKRLKILNKTVDFGDVTSDTILTAKFYFVNTGTKEVIISSVNPDCTCTGYSISKDVLSPSDTAYVELRLNTEHKCGHIKLCAAMKTDTHTKMYKFTIIANMVRKEN